MRYLVEVIEAEQAHGQGRSNLTVDIPTPHIAKSLGAFNHIDINHETLN